MGRVAAALRALVAPRKAAAEAEPVAQAEAPRIGGEEAAARIDAARERLRATIAPPDDEDAGESPQNEKRDP